MKSMGLSGPDRGYMGLPLKNSGEKWSIGLIERRIREKGNISINPGSFRKNPPQSPFLKGGRYRNALPYEKFRPR